MCDTAQLSLFQQATALYNERKFEECLNLLARCLEVGSTSMILNNRGIVHYRLGNFSKARQDLESSIKLDHLNFLAYFNLFSINTLHEQYSAAFDSLSLALSSLNTNKCRQERNILYADQALYYSQNNKEAMMIKGLILLEQKQYHRSLQMIRQALRWESKETHRQEMIAVMRLVAEMAPEESTDFNIKFVGGPFFELKPSLPQPSSEQYPLKIKSMLQEFNRLYQSLLDSEKSDIQSSSIQQASHILQAHQDLLLKDDKNSNKVTANNSIMINDYDSSLSDHERNKDTSNILPETKESLTFIDRTTENSVIALQESTITHLKEGEVKQSESKVRRQINFRVQYAEIDKHNLSKLYAVLQYNKSKNSFFFTSLISSQNQYYIWNEVSEPFDLASSPEYLTLKLYNKDFSRFNDELIGKGTILIGQLGTATIPLYRGYAQTGSIVVAVAMPE